MISATIALILTSPIPFSNHRHRSRPSLLNIAASSEKSPGRSRGSRRGSVLGNNRPAEPVIDAGGEEVDVLLDAVARDAQPRRDESDGLPVHEQVVILEADRPIRREAVFDAGTDHPAPARVAGRGQ